MWLQSMRGYLIGRVGTLAKVSVPNSVDNDSMGAFWRPLGERLPATPASEGEG